MTALSTAAPRRAIHTRRIAFQSFLREDGLWDIDCELVDTKAIAVPLLERDVLPPGEPLHHIRVRLTIDEGLTVRAAEAAAAAAPFGECRQSVALPVQRLVGLTMGTGWRKAIDAAMGGEGGCTHVRELVFNAATAAFQTIPHYLETAGGSRKPDLSQVTQPPFYVGQCMTWAFDGAVAHRQVPQFARPRPSTKD